MAACDTFKESSVAWCSVPCKTDSHRGWLHQQDLRLVLNLVIYHDLVVLLVVSSKAFLYILSLVRMRCEDIALFQWLVQSNVFHTDRTSEGRGIQNTSPSSHCSYILFFWTKAACEQSLTASSSFLQSDCSSLALSHFLLYYFSYLCVKPMHPGNTRC